MRDKCEDRCPFCAETVAQHGEGYHRVYVASSGKYSGRPRCEGCGAYFVDGEWFKECSLCGKRTDELHLLFVPHACKECADKVVEGQRRAGRICTRCRQPYALCCC